MNTKINVLEYIVKEGIFMFDKWYESAKSLLNLYKKLTELKIEGRENTEEYNLILSLLESAIKFENEKIEKINFTDENLCDLYELILEHISGDNPLTISDMLTDDDALIYARIHNIAEDIDYNRRESKTENIPCNSIYESIASLIVEQDEKDTKFIHAFQCYTGFNIIYIINLAISYIKDKETKKFLTKLLFASIYVNPTYEEYFKNAMTISKPINISLYLSHLINEKYSKEELMHDIMYNLVDFTTHEIEMEINKKDSDLLDKNEYFEYVKNLTNVMGKLISMLDTSIIDTVEEKIKKIIESKTRDDNIRIVNEIVYMFDVARNIIKKCAKERELIYGKITEETN